MPALVASSRLRTVWFRDTAVNVVAVVPAQDEERLSLGICSYIWVKALIHTLNSKTYISFHFHRDKHHFFQFFYTFFCLT